MKSKKQIQLEKELEEIKAKAKAKRKKWHMYEDAGCSECDSSGHYMQHQGSGSMRYVNMVRCNCAYVKTDRYVKALNNKKVSVEKYEKKLGKFIDNNNYIKNSYGSDNLKTWD